MTRDLARDRFAALAQFVDAAGSHAHSIDLFAARR